jgi:hypothetical protein
MTRAQWIRRAVDVARLRRIRRAVDVARLRLEVVSYEEVAGRRVVTARALTEEPRPGAVVLPARIGQARRIGDSVRAALPT